MYGWRARVGMLVPSTNTVAEPEYVAHLPDGVSLHTARMLITGTDAESVEAMEDYVEDSAALIGTIDVDVAVYNCTVGSLLKGPGAAVEIEDRLAEIVGAPVVATAASVRRALQALGAESISLTTPYPKDVNRREVDFLEEEGFSVLAESGLDIEDPLNLGAQRPETAYERALEVDRPGADAIFISCADYRTFEVIDRLERDTGKPVVTSNQATLWDALGTAGVDYSDVELGALFGRPH